MTVQLPPSSGGKRSRVHAIAVLCAVAVLAAGGIRAITAGPGAYVRSGAEVTRATAQQSRAFGGTPLDVSLGGPLATTLDPANLSAELALENHIRALSDVRSVLGPAGFIADIASEINRVISTEVASGGAHGRAAIATATQQLLVRYGYQGRPSLSNASFIGQLAFGSSATTPVGGLRWLLPNRTHALIIVRPVGSAGEAAVRQLVGRIRRLADAAGLQGVTASVAEPRGDGAAGSSAPQWLWLAIAIAVVAGVATLLFGTPLILWQGLLAASLTIGAGLLAFGTLSSATAAALSPVVALSAGLQGLRLSRPVVLEIGAAIAGSGLVLTVASDPLIERFGWELAIGVTAGTLLAARTAATSTADDAGRRSGPRNTERRVSGLHARVSTLASAAVAIVAVAGLALLPSMPIGTTDSNGRGLSFVVSGNDVAIAAGYHWLETAQHRVTAQHPAVGLGPSIATILDIGLGGSAPTDAGISDLLAAIPHRLMRTLVSPDHMLAEMTFELPAVSAAAQASLAAQIERGMPRPPFGYTVRPAGQLALAAAAAGSMSGSRAWLLLLIAATFLFMLLSVTRGVRPAAAATATGLVALGWGVAIARVAGIELSPLSAGLELVTFAVGAAITLAMVGGAREASIDGVRAPRDRPRLPDRRPRIDRARAV